MGDKGLSLGSGEMKEVEGISAGGMVRTEAIVMGEGRCLVKHLVSLLVGGCSAGIGLPSYLLPIGSRAPYFKRDKGSALPRDPSRDPRFHVQNVP